jgi:hypothetical protein
MTEPAAAPRPVYAVRFKVEPNIARPDAMLRALLKSALRRHGLRCIELREETQ